MWTCSVASVAHGQFQPLLPAIQVQEVAQEAKPVEVKDAEKDEEKDDEKTSKPSAKQEEDERVVEIPSTRKVSPDGITLFLMDGSVISGRLALSEIEVETDFGKLKVPIAKLKTFTPGLGSHPDLGTKIVDLIEDLGSSDFGEREAAQKALLEMGPSVRMELEKRADDKDTERRTRIRKILTEFDELADDEEVDPDEPEHARGLMIQRDAVETSEFTIIGRIVQQNFMITSLYGPLTVRLADIRKAQRDIGERPELRKNFAVDGTDLVQSNFKSTGIRVQRGDKITVAADGTITMTPWGNEAITTPDGSTNYGWYIPGQIPGGSLVARIGDNGNIFKVGSKSNFTADRAGILQFAVAVQSDYANNAFPGRYNVKLRVKPK